MRAASEGASTGLEPRGPLARLTRSVDTHPLWSCRLLRACESGSLDREAFAFLFAQYSEYSRQFTRYLCAAMANCPDDRIRARLSENLWEEGGGTEPNRRHAEIYRHFLKSALGIDPQAIVAHDFAKLFALQYLDYCLRSPATASGAFLSLGTEAIVPRLYQVLRHGLVRAGIDAAHLEFFDIHIAGDDLHAATLVEMMCLGTDTPGWEETCRAAAAHALDLRLAFFDAVADALEEQRTRALTLSLRAGAGPEGSEATLVHRMAGEGRALYRNRDEAQGIDFAVERLPFAGEVLDPRMVRVSAGQSNELHRHAHETVIHVVRGRARLLVGSHSFELAAGDTGFVPRWLMHQTQSIGDEDLVYFAVTDFGFASKAQVGDYLEGHRQRRELDRSFA
jgi:pyrroloquinoline-quinone synthase